MEKKSSVDEEILTDLLKLLDSVKQPEISASVTAEEVAESDDLKSEADAPKGAEYEDRVVAFVDILGFTEIIKKSATQPELFKKIFFALDMRQEDWAKIFAAEVGFESGKAFDDRFHSFSDFIIMSVPQNIEAVGLLIYAIFKICRQLLGHGLASRGGIAMGKLFHRDNADGDAHGRLAPSMVFGPAFIEAYQFESSHADGPRVILQNKLLQFIEAARVDSPDTKLSKFLKVHIQRADDGPAFIDLFADFHINEFYETERNLNTEIEAIHAYICKALDESTDRPHHFKKNAQLAKEFNLAVRRANITNFVIDGSRLPKRHA